MSKQKQQSALLESLSRSRLSNAVAKKSKSLAWAIVVGAMTLTSCHKDEKTVDNAAVRFTAGINQEPTAEPESRASGSAWTSGDAIGVFMMQSGTALESNNQYTTDGTSTFTAVAGDELYYPMDGSAVNFIAYYPWKTGTALGNIDVEIGTTQTTATQPTFDLLWASANNGGTGYNKVSHATTAVPLVFTHKLAKLVMNCSADPSVEASLTGMTVTIKGMNTENTFNLSTGDLGSPDTPADITPRTITDGSVYDAIIMPGAYDAADVTVEFVAGGETFTWDVGATSFAGGNEYTYAVTLTRTGVLVSGTITPWITSGNDRGGVSAN